MKKYFTALVLLFACTYTAFAQRIALFETFTNASCSSCATYMPLLTTITDTTIQNIIQINYHTLTPGLDSMHANNPIENTARFNMYGVFGTPWTQINGTTPIGTGPLTTWWNTYTASFGTALAPKFTIDFQLAKNNNSFYKTKVRFTSNDNFTSGDTLTAFVVLIENLVNESDFVAPPGYNSETQHHYVMRKFLNTTTGSLLTNVMLGGTTTLEVASNCTYLKHESEARYVAFVQNMHTKEVLQAAIINPDFTTNYIEEMVDTIAIFNTTYDTISTAIHDTVYVSDTTIATTTTTGYTTYTTPTMSYSVALDTTTAFDPITTLHHVIIHQNNLEQNVVIATTTTTVYIDTTTTDIAYFDNANDYLVYPNPFKNELFIRSIHQIASIEMYDMLGNKLTQLPIQNHIYLGEMPAGIYYLTLQKADGTTIIKKIVSW